jgi:hypothetical protein
MKKGNITALIKWRKHLEESRLKNPNKSLKECMVVAKKTYKK